MLAKIVNDETKKCEKPATATEMSVHQAMRELLNRGELSVDQRFFDAGGNSLLVTRLANELETRMGMRIPVNVLMDNHSARSLAEIIDTIRNASSEQSMGEDTIEIEI